MFVSAVPEMPRTRANHRDTGSICRRNGFLIANGSARLNDRRDAGLRRRFHGITEREKRIGSKHRAFCLRARLFQGDLRRADTVHLSRADAERRVRVGHDNRIRFDMTHDRPSEAQGLHFFRRRLPLGDDLPCRFVVLPIIGATS